MVLTSLGKTEKIKLHYITLHYIALHYITLHSMLNPLRVLISSGSKKSGGAAVDGLDVIDPQ